jgi:hypothetical protein
MMTRQEFLAAAAAFLGRPAAEPALIPKPKRFHALGDFVRAPARVRTVRGDPGAPSGSPEAYRLRVEKAAITVTSRSDAGLAMGRRTAVQLQAAGSVPLGELVDWPDASFRAAHLCYHLMRETLAYNCPNYKALLEQIDQYAALKYNGVLLELESMFPFRKNPVVSCRIAFTRDEIASIGARLAAHGMEIVPLVQCLGHAYNVLTHHRYAAYREVPNTCQQYCPTNPALPDLYMQFVDEYLELFPGIRRWHMGGDESRQLAQCPRCKEKAAREGLSKLYVDHVADIARRLRSRGLQPMVWSDMLEHYPEAIAALPGWLEIVYWNYDLPKWPRPYAAKMFSDRGLRVVGAPGVRFGSSGTELSVYYPEALRGIESLIPKMYADGCGEFLVTNWMKGSPHENTHYGMAWAADLCWNTPATRAGFQDRYAAVAFGLPDRAVCDVYELLSLELPYAEPVQRHMPDRLNRFDLSGFRFPEKWKRYSSREQEPRVMQQLEAGLASARKAEALLDRVSSSATRGRRQLELLRLSAECIQAKARLSLALHRRSRVEAGVAAAWKEAKRKHRAMLLESGFAPCVEFLNELMFEPAELEAFGRYG